MKIKVEAKQKYDARTNYTGAEWNQIRIGIKNTLFDTYIRELIIKAAESGQSQITLVNMFKNCLVRYSETQAPIAYGKIEKLNAEKWNEFNEFLKNWLEQEQLVVTLSGGSLIVSGWAS